MDFYQLFILSCFKEAKPMRTSTLYHLLKGKRTSSILTYGYFYDALKYFALLPKLKETTYNQIISDLKTNNYLLENKDGLSVISEEGLALFNQENFPETSNLQQMVYYKWDLAFFERIVFTTQVLSEKAYLEKQYLPIETNLFKQQRLKIWLSKQKKDVVTSFYYEWDKLVDCLPIDGQELILKQLVGHNHRGQTLQQISEEKTKPPLYLYLEFKNYWHLLITEIIENSNNYPLFASILIEEKTFVKEDSSQKTSELVLKGYSIEEIARVRNLKISTVTDHLIEDYILNQTKINLIDEKASDFLLAYYQKDPNYTLWTFKEATNYYPDLSFYDFKFFQFRLFEKEREND